MKTILLALLLVTALHAQSPFPGLTFHHAPKALAKEATTADWPRFLGPADNCTTPESPLLEKFPSTGLPLVFEISRGDSYASPIIADGRLLHFHALEGKETLDCLHPETGQRFWSFDYPITYKDRYGFSTGPRSSPVVDGDRIYLIGVTAMLHCLDLKSGTVIWKRDLMKEFEVPKYFFGYAPNPVVHKDKLILNVGGKAENKSGTSVVALDTKTGKTVWEHKDTWGASYASPIITTLHKKPVVLVLAAGESKPAHGGLLVLDPETGKLHFRFPWRADIYESVLASTPSALPGNRVFISDCYKKGGVLLQFDEELQGKPVWIAQEFGMHMMVPQLLDGHLYGFAGRNIPDTEFKCLELATGKVVWQDEMRWKENERVTGLFRGSLLQAGKRTFSLGEDGSFAELSLTPKGPKILQRTRLFSARETWTPPVIHRGLLYIMQNTDGFDGTKRRLVCYDLRP
jgi:outer membrane protein assembly factor BamB